MLKGLFVILWLTVMPCVALGQGEQTMEDTLREISKDLAGLHQEVKDAYRTQTTQSYALPSTALGYRIRITRDQSAIRAGADDSAGVLTKASRGTSFNVIDKVGDWYAVSLLKPTKEGLVSGWVKASMATPEVKTLTYMDEATSLSEQNSSIRIYEQITKSVTAIRKKYENNPYVKITGFTVNVAIIPSVTVSFEFK